MSFDLILLQQSDDGAWIQPSPPSPRSPLTARDIELWEQLVPRVRQVIPDLEVSGTAPHVRDMYGERSGLRIALYAGGTLFLNMSFGDRGDEAQQRLTLLRRVVEVVESTTGMTGWDPQNDTVFRDEDDADVLDVFDTAHDVITEVRASSPPTSPRSAGGYG